MPQIYYLPDEQRVEAKIKETILKASLRSKIPHAHACRGRARCSTCRVVILEGMDNCTPPTSRELKLSTKLHFESSIRLACQTKVLGDIKLRRPVLDEIDIQLTDQRTGISEYVGEEKKIAILFSDIIGYTPFAESLPPYDVVHVLNRYYFQMNKIITQNHGMVSDFIGDGICALFGVDEGYDAPLNSVKSALEMFQAVQALNNYLQPMFHRTFQIRIGIHYGNAVVGTFGALHQKKISAIGDAVNLASRIEQANKETKTRLLISDDAYKQVKDQVITGQKFPMEIRGKHGKYELYEITGLNGTY